MSEHSTMGSPLWHTQSILSNSLTSTVFRDELARNRFLPLLPGSHLKPAESKNGTNGLMPKWLQKNTYYNSESGPNCCSDSAISFHYVAPVAVSLIFILHMLIALAQNCSHNKVPFLYMVCFSLCRSGQTNCEPNYPWKQCQTWVITRTVFRDELARHRFLPHLTESMLKPPEANNTNWSPWWLKKYHDSGPRPNLLSDSAISFHYTSPASVS